MALEEGRIRRSGGQRMCLFVRERPSTMGTGQTAMMQTGSALTFQNHIAPRCLCLKTQPHDNQQTPVPLQPTWWSEMTTTTC